MMKKTLAAILFGILLLASVSTAGAAGTDYTLRIPGGGMDAAMTNVGGDRLLKVDVYLDGVTDDKLLTGLSFDLSFDPAQLEYATDSQSLGILSLCAVDRYGQTVDDRSVILNANGAAQGTLKVAFASDYGCRIKTDMPLLSFYFFPDEDLPGGEEIAFTVSNTQAESVKRSDQTGSGKYTKRTVGADCSPYTVSASGNDVEINAAIEFDPADVGFKGSTPYVVYNGLPQTPRVTVIDADTGDTINPRYYTLAYADNTGAGTATVEATFRRGYSGTASAFFKIYLPATADTTVENIGDGIQISWEPVEGAKGYVVYRRAWNLTSSGWTSFERWFNTTETTWTDGSDDSHKVYAGTRYQYGVKAYPVDPMNNYDLGVVGPLKTTVRITTRKLVSVTPGTGRITVKWERSKLFTGYQIQYATNGRFTSGLREVIVADADLNITDPQYGSQVIRYLTSGKRYYVRVRSYHEFEGMTYYGEWSETKSGVVK